MFCSVGCEGKAKDYLSIWLHHFCSFFFSSKVFKKHYLEIVENICFTVVFVVAKEISSGVLLNCIIYNHFPFFYKVMDLVHIKHIMKSVNC